jgi:hypothetical protein
MANSLAITYALVNTILSLQKVGSGLDEVLYRAGGERPQRMNFGFVAVFVGCSLSERTTPICA